MGKKAARGPYFFFMLDYQSKNGTNYAMDELQVAASQEWQDLLPRERAHFEKMAKDYKQQALSSVSSVSSSCSYERYTSQNVPLSKLEIEAKKNENKEKSMKKHIIEMIQSAKLEQTLKTQVFYIIGFNHFCKSIDSYLPAEVSVLKFNLQDGVVDVCHEFIDPEKIPCGLAYEAKVHTDATHQLPLPPKAKGDDIFTVINKILDFIYDPDAVRLPPFFTMLEDIPMVNEILQKMLKTTFEGAVARNSGGYQNQDLLVYPLSQLLFELKNVTACVPNDKFKSIHIAQGQLLTDRYDYTSGIGCEYHKNQTFEKFCSLSFVKRCAYTIADLCATDLDIELVQGKHVPLMADVVNLYVASNDDFSDTRSFITCNKIDETTDNETILTHITSPLITRKVYESDTDNLSGFTSVSQRPPQIKKLMRHKPNPWRMQAMARDLVSTEASEDEDEGAPLTGARRVHVELNCTNPFRREIYERASMLRASNRGYSVADDDEKQGNVFDRSYQIARQPIVQTMNFTMPSQGRGKLMPSSAASSVASSVASGIGRGRIDQMKSPTSISSVGSGLGRGSFFSKFE